MVQFYPQLEVFLADHLRYVSRSLHWSSKCSFKYHMSMSSFMCGSKGTCLFISSSYHTCIWFIFSPLHYNTTHFFFLATFYGCPFVMVLMWACHWWFRYPFVLVPLWGWAYNSPWYTLRYYCNYCLEKWNICLKGGLPPFPSSHPMSSGYPYH
jgi:hypothetical protein